MKKLILVLSVLAVIFSSCSIKKEKKTEAEIRRNILRRMEVSRDLNVFSSKLTDGLKDLMAPQTPFDSVFNSNLFEEINYKIRVYNKRHVEERMILFNNEKQNNGKINITPMSINSSKTVLESSILAYVFYIGREKLFCAYAKDNFMAGYFSYAKTWTWFDSIRMKKASETDKDYLNYLEEFAVNKIIEVEENIQNQKGVFRFLE